MALDLERLAQADRLEDVILRVPRVWLAGDVGVVVGVLPEAVVGGLLVFSKVIRICRQSDRWLRRDSGM
jgi:hypothetical protein